MSALALIARLPHRLRMQVVRLLYLKRGRYLQDLVSFGGGRFHAYKVGGIYVPSEGLSWYLTFEHYQARLLEAAAWGYRPRSADTVLDIGAGIGEEAIVLAKMVGPAGRVLCVEANPEAFEVLEHIVKLNGMQNVVSAFNLAISANGAPVDLTIDQSFLAGTTGACDSAGRRYTVPGIRLDTFLTENGVDRVALLKSNIEGAERFVVETLGGFVRNVDHFAIACHDFRFEKAGNPFFKTKGLVTEYLRTNGRQTASQSTGHQWKDDWVYCGP